jgi:WD40 repeat protein
MDSLELNGTSASRPYILGIDYSPDGRYLLSCGEDGTVRLWDVSTSTCKYLLLKDKWVAPTESSLFLNLGGASCQSVAFSSDGMWIATGGRDGITIWETSLVLSGHLSELTKDDDQSQQYRLKFQADESEGVGRLEYSPDDKFLVASDANGLTIWNWHIGKPMRSFEFTSVVPYSQRPLVVSADALWISAVYEKRESLAEFVRMWDVQTGSIVHDLGPSDMSRNGVIRTLAFSPDGSRIAAGSRNGIVQVWSTSSGELLQIFSSGITG